MSLLPVATKTLRELMRRPKYLATMLGIPLAFMFIFGAAFGGDDETTYRVAVVDGDTGPQGARFTEGLAALEYPSGAALVDVEQVDDEASGRALLADGDVDLLLVIPTTFSRDLASRGSTLDIVSDSAQAGAIAARQIVAGHVQAFVEEATGQAPRVVLHDRSAQATERTTFDFIAPGLMVFAMLMLVTHAAVGLARERESHTLDRVRLSRTRSPEFLGGLAVAHFVLSAATLLLMLLAAELMGFHNQGGFAAAYLIALVASLGVLGIGLAIAAFVTTADEAGNVATMVSVPLSFLSGSFFPVPGVDLVTIAGTTVGLYDLLPTTHAVDAMHAVMTRGQGLADVAGSLVAMAGLAVLYFAVGVGLYSWRRLRVA